MWIGECNEVLVSAKFEIVNRSIHKIAVTWLHRVAFWRGVCSRKIVISSFPTYIHRWSSFSRVALLDCSNCASVLRITINPSVFRKFGSWIPVLMFINCLGAPYIMICFFIQYGCLLLFVRDCFMWSSESGILSFMNSRARDFVQNIYYI
jgi:hypothetical protein